MVTLAVGSSEHLARVFLPYFLVTSIFTRPGSPVEGCRLFYLRINQWYPISTPLFPLYDLVITDVLLVSFDLLQPSLPRKPGLELWL